MSAGLSVRIRKRLPGFTLDVAWEAGDEVGVDLRGVPRLHRELLRDLPVDQDHELVRLVQALDQLVAVAHEADADVVVAVLGEGVREPEAAPGAVGEPVDAFFLGHVGEFLTT